MTTIDDPPTTAPKSHTRDGGTHTKNTLFLRGLPAHTTAGQLEAFFSEWGPVRSAFTVPSKQAVSKGKDETKQKTPVKEAKKTLVGFVHFALAEDARRAVEVVQKGVEFEGGKVTGELALRKSQAKQEHLTKTAKRTKSSEQEDKEEKPSPVKKPKVTVEKEEPVRSASLLVSFAASEKATAFDKKQLYKKARKVGELKEVSYPHEGLADQAKLLFSSILEARKAFEKLQGHVFKGHTISVQSDPKAASKAHRLIIRNLPFSIKQTVMVKAFSEYGRVVELTMPMKNMKEGRGFAFVQMASREEAAKLMEAFNGKELAGRMIVLDWAVNKTTFEKLQAKDETLSKEAEVEVKAEKEDESESEDESEGTVDVDVEEEDKDTGDEAHAAAESQDQEIDIEGDSDVDPESASKSAKEPEATTVFIRNVSFATEEADLFDALSRFGPLEYCKIVRDLASGAPKGTAFAKFRRGKDAASACKVSQAVSQFQLEAQQNAVEDASTPKMSALEESLNLVGSKLANLARKRTGKEFQSLIDVAVLTNEATENAQELGIGQGIVVDGRALNLVPAVDRKQAAKLKQDGGYLDSGPQDRRNLYLLNETSLKPKTQLAKKFWPAVDVGHRETILKDRRKELKNNPNLFVSRTRLSIRHLPVSVTEADLKRVLKLALQRALALQPTDEGYPLMDDKVLRHLPSLRSSPLTQVKIVCEPDRKRSKGYGFVEFRLHEHALLALRYLSNFAPGLWRELVADKFGKAKARHTQGGAFRAKAPVIEFATEKMAVVTKRMERLEQLQKQKQAK